MPTYTGDSCQYHESVDGKNWVKLARTAKANSLVVNETRRLKQVLAGAGKDWAYFPVFVESFRVNSGGKSRLQATVFSRAPEQLHSFVEVLDQFPGGIDGLVLTHLDRGGDIATFERELGVPVMISSRGPRRDDKQEPK